MRIDILGVADRGEIGVDRLRDILKACARVDDEAAVGAGDDFGAFVEVVFVLDVADDHFDDVLDRGEAVGAAIFVDDQAPYACASPAS